MGNCSPYPDPARPGEANLGKPSARSRSPEGIAAHSRAALRDAQPPPTRGSLAMAERILENVSHAPLFFPKTSVTSVPGFWFLKGLYQFLTAPA